MQQNGNNGELLVATIMRNIFLLFLAIASSNASAFFWDTKIKVLCYDSNSLNLTFTYELKEKEMYETVVMPKKDTISGKDELINLTKLADCTIKDSRNWSCGGKNSLLLSKPYRSDTHSVLEGSYRFIPPVINGVQKDFLCERRVQSN
jgi:hypothetical protein